MTRGATLDYRRAPMMRALGVLALALAFATPAFAQDTGVTTADGRADYCRLSAGRALCTASGDAATGRAWVDFNGDGRADYCRRVGGAPSNTRVSCTISNGTGFGPLPSAQLAPTPTPNPAPLPTPAPPGGRPDVPLKRIVIFLRWDKSASRTSTRLKYLRVTDVPRDSLKPLVRKRLKVGTTITVTVSRPNEIGAVEILKVRPRKDPSIKTRCLAPGAKRPSTC